jgi:signal transduction histidine kinase
VDQTEGTGTTALVRREPGDEADGLRRLAEVVAATADLTTAIREINRLVAGPLGIRVQSCALANPQLRAASGAAAPTPAEAAAVDLWRASLRHGSPVEPMADPADAHRTLVPVVHRRRVHGAVRVVVDGAGLAAASLLPAIGVACGEVAWKASVRRELARNRRRLAIAVEQERTARDVQTSVHHRLALMGDRLAAHLAEAPDRVWRERMQELLLLTGEVDRDVRKSLNVLRTLPAQGDDLPASLRSIARKVMAESDLYVKLVVDGEPRRVSTGRAEALFHVAVEALVGAAFGARAANAVVVLSYGAAEVRLVVRDDGVGLSQRNLFQTSVSQGIRGLQDRLARVGGRLRLSALSPRGAVVEATVPIRRSSADAGAAS